MWQRINPLVDKFLAHCADPNFVDSDDRLYRGARPHASRVSKVRANRTQVVILRQSSNFGGATVPWVYVNRDCPDYFYPDAAVDAGGAQLDWSKRKQATEAVSGWI